MDGWFGRAGDGWGGERRGAGQCLLSRLFFSGIAARVLPPPVLRCFHFVLCSDKHGVPVCVLRLLSVLGTLASIWLWSGGSQPPSSSFLLPPAFCLPSWPENGGGVGGGRRGVLTPAQHDRREGKRRNEAEHESNMTDRELGSSLFFLWFAFFLVLRLFLCSLALFVFTFFYLCLTSCMHTRVPPSSRHDHD